MYEGLDHSLPPYNPLELSAASETSEPDEVNAALERQKRREWIRKSTDPELNAAVELWMKWDRNPVTRIEMADHTQYRRWKVLRTRLLERIAFGTAGLRACMRAGFDSMNDLIVVQTAQGLCEYIRQHYPRSKDQDRGIVVGYDGRYNSKRYAELTACVFMAREIKVYLYGRMVATPFVPFAIRLKKCLAGVMVTASHNPKQDNGYKVYWSNGAQIISPQDNGIQYSIMQNLEPKDSSWNTDVLKKTHSLYLEDPYEEVAAAYYSALTPQFTKKHLLINECSQLRFVYTAMHGVGYPYIKMGFEAAKLTPVVPVKEQIEADPEFPTVEFPNPEEGKAALNLAIKRANAENITIIIANDPDADRLACAEKHHKTGVWKVFNGNELAALLGWWALENFKAVHPDIYLSDCYMIASTVSSRILHTLAEYECFNFLETLTGFKWMGNIADQILQKGKHVIFAFEESIGYMFGTKVLDKDGISAGTHLATMACYLRAMRSMTLHEKLDEIYHQYGYHFTSASYFVSHDPLTFPAMFKRIRTHSSHCKRKSKDGNGYPKSTREGGYRIKYVRDLTTGVDTAQPNNKAILPVSADIQMITFTFENNLVFTMRTSGTEPKIKYYSEFYAHPAEKNWSLLREEMEKMLAILIEEFMAPKMFNLKPKKD